MRSRRTRENAAQAYAAGKALRDKVPRERHAEWRAPPSRPDVLASLRAAHRGRLPELVPIRIGRMASSPFAFFRGGADVMAWDLARTPRSGLEAWLCGDAHLLNFGFYASPERALVFDVNDFDETIRGPWEWDLKRLAASVVLAGRANGVDAVTCRDAARAALEEYRAALHRLRVLPHLEAHFVRLDSPTEVVQHLTPKSKTKVVKAARRAEHRTGERARERLATRGRGDTWRFVTRRPLLVRLDASAAGDLSAGIERYARRLAPHWREVLERYVIADAALKVVGVGSVGVRAYVALLVGRDLDDTLLLQVKEARPSALAPYVSMRFGGNDAQRIVEGQVRIQTVSDPLLGWTTIRGRPFLVRQLADMKGSARPEKLTRRYLAEYARLCGALLAKAHARSGDADRLAGYCGKADVLDRAFAAFAAAYADQTERDHAVLAKAVASGRVAAIEGV